MKLLQGQVAVVAGATRGAGRGISRALGDAGATVYCSGRSSRTEPNTTDHHYAGRPETIEETAELVTAAGGTGIAVRVDHTVEAEVAALFARVQREQKRLDVLVNVLTGKPVASWKSFWNLPLDESRRFQKFFHEATGFPVRTLTRTSRRFCSRLTRANSAATSASTV